MTTITPNLAGSISKDSSFGYVDAILGIFDRPKKSKNFKQSMQEKTVSTDNLLRKSPLVRAKVLEPKGNPWNSGVLRRIPYQGTLALLAVILCAAADGIILWKSDGQEVDTWFVSPSVLLAIFSATANLCLQYARSQGVIIAWWRKAICGGTLHDLNEYWEFGDSILAAGTAGRRINFVAFATLAASAIVLDGPFLQKASSIAVKEVNKPVIVTALTAEELPYGYTGYGSIEVDPDPGPFVMTQSTADAVNGYTTRAPITADFAGCDGTCSGIVKVAGLAVNCTENEVPWNSAEANFNVSTVFQSTFNWWPGGSFRQSNYSSNWTEGPFPDTPIIDFQLVYGKGRVAGVGTGGGAAESPINAPGAFVGCSGTLIMKRCSMRSATLEYPVQLENNTISLNKNSSNFAIDHIQEVGQPSTFYDYHDLNPLSYTTLGGIAKAAQNMFASNAGQQGNFLSLNGSLASQYIEYGSGNSSYFQTQDACAVNWYDPTSDIVDALNEIIFRTALTASNVSDFSIMNSNIHDSWTSYYEMYPVNYTSLASGMPTAQTISMSQISQITVFQSHYEFLGAALGVMIFGVAVVIPLFHSFWRFGRDVSLNPLEIAKAFNAELLQEQGSNSTVEKLAKHFGEKEVRYGEIIDHGNGTRLEEVRRQGRRLGLADPSQVKEPRFQEIYM